jgi:hypothetical protein
MPTNTTSPIEPSIPPVLHHSQLYGATNSKIGEPPEGTARGRQDLSVPQEEQPDGASAERESQGPGWPQASRLERSVRLPAFAGSVTRALAARLQAMADSGKQSAFFAETARKLRACARGSSRCGQSVCPRCAARRARRNRCDQDRIVQRIPSSTPLLLLTLLVGADDPNEGLDLVRDAFQTLRTRTLWTRAIEGGEAHFEAIPSAGAGRLWNCHLHAILERRKRGPPRARRASRSVGATRRGPLPMRPAGNRETLGALPRRDGREVVAAHVLHEQAQTLGMAPAERRRAASDCLRGREAPLQGSLWLLAQTLRQGDRP